MPIGIHSFYAKSLLLRITRENYFLGSFYGDHANDESYAARIDRVAKRLADIYGWGGFSCCWHPAVVKPVRRLSSEQKYKRAINKAINIHNKKVLEIFQNNFLFLDDFLSEEIKRHHHRVSILKERYNK